MPRDQRWASRPLYTRPPGLYVMLVAALVAATLAPQATAKRCSPSGPAYDIEGRFKAAPPGWRLSTSVFSGSFQVFKACRADDELCCQYSSDWGRAKPGTPPPPPAVKAGDAGKCLNATEVAAMACLAMEACTGFSPDGTLYQM